MTLSRAAAGGFTVDDFTIDETLKTATCPAGIVRPISVKGRVSFGGSCTTCPLMSHCTTAKTGRKLVILPYDRLRREHRVRAQDPEFQVRVSQAPTHGRTLHRVDDPRSTEGPLPRRREEQRLVGQPSGRHQPQTTLESRTHQPEQGLEDAETIHARRTKAGLPDRQRHRTKWGMALEMIDELAAWGHRPPALVGDAG